jgi:hypothetical protein
VRQVFRRLRDFFNPIPQENEPHAVYNEVAMELDGDIKEASEALIASLEALSPGQVRGSDIYGNSLGIGLVTELAELRDMVANREPNLRRFEDTFQKIGDTLQELSCVSIGYQRIREGFLAKFQKDCQGPSKPGEPLFKVTIERNTAAHSGDAVTDAKICEGPKGDELMVEIYGSTTGEVLTLREY